MSKKLPFLFPGTDSKTMAARFIDLSMPEVYEQRFEFPKSLGDFISTGVINHDQFVSIQDGDPVVRTYDNFTIGKGHTVTPTNRCKGLYLNILGDLIVNGTLSMTARGAAAPGKFVGIHIGRRTIFFDATADSWNPGQDLYVINKVGGLGNRPGTGGACAGGGKGAAVGIGVGGNGAAGTSFSGGSGGGGGCGKQGGAGASNGGTGGAGGNNIGATGAAGGAGNPGGAKAGVSSVGSNGTGGLLILFVRGNIIIGPNGSIQSSGSNGGAGNSTSGKAGAHGGGSGGGAIHIFHKGTISGPNKITAPGGTVNGGAGTVNIVKI